MTTLTGSKRSRKGNVFTRSWNLSFDFWICCTRGTAPVADGALPCHWSWTPGQQVFDSANSLFQTGHQRKGTLFQRYQQISVVTSIMVSIRAGKVKQQKSKVLALVNASLLEVLAGLLNSCMLLLLQPNPATYWARGTSFHGHHGWRRVKQQKSKVLALENASLLEVLQLSH